MTLTDFNSLSRTRQLAALRTGGTFLGNRLYQGYVVSLFQVEGFYVELWKRAGLNYVEFVEVVRDESRLEAYADTPEMKQFLKFVRKSG